MTATVTRYPAELRIEAVAKRFGRLDVLRGVDLTIAPGRITAIVGPNAAGKTTLIKAVLGLVRLRPGQGRILFDGEPVSAGHRYRERIGYMPQAARFPEQLTGREVLTLLRELRGNPADVDDELIGRLGFEASLDKPVRTLSGGTRQKLNAAVAFLFRPSLLILDEPTAGLVPVASGVLKDKVLAATASGTTVLLTSHLMGEIEELAQDLVFLLEGQVRFQGSVESLIARTGEPRLERAVARLMLAAA
jgi:Cu-processing system ATP-binding protein